MTTFENAVSMMPQTTLLHRAVALRLLGQPRRDEVEREIVGVLELRRPLRTERFAHSLELARRETVVEREHASRRRSRSTSDCASRSRVFSTCHCSSPHSSACACTWPPAGPAGGLRRADRRVDAALRRAAQREPLDRLRRTACASRGARIEEDVDRPPPRGERRRRHDRREHRILVVLAHRHDPHPDAVLLHQRGQHGVHPLLEPALLQIGLLAQRAERPIRLDLLRVAVDAAAAPSAKT